MNILYLYSELMGYQVPVFREYVTKYQANVHVVHWDKNRLKPYNPEEVEGVRYYNRSSQSRRTLVQLAESISPDIIYISGWMDVDYLAVAGHCRKKGLPVVTGFDDQWKGSARQRVAALLFPYLYMKYFSHAWVAGPYQYEYASRLGFHNSKIVFNLLSANTDVFSRGAQYLESKANNYPRSFLYVGNFRLAKGTDLLVQAYKKYRSEHHGTWNLICVGNGTLRSLLADVDGIEVVEFAGEEELVDIAGRAGVFVLPSRSEQWGVVVHEFAAAAMPLLLSESVGARPVFLVDNFNGISYGGNSVDSLARAMHLMSCRTDEELVEMARRSLLLSRSITPQISAASFMSIVARKAESSTPVA